MEIGSKEWHETMAEKREVKSKIQLKRAFAIAERCDKEFREKQEATNG